MCGTNERIVGQVWQEEVEKGKVRREIHPSCNTHHVAVADPARPPTLTVPILVFLEDVCAKCGTRYIYRVELTQGQPAMGPPGKIPPSSFSTQ